MNSKVSDILRWGIRDRVTDKSVISYPVNAYPMRFIDDAAEKLYQGSRGVGIVRDDNNTIICHAGSDYQLLKHADVLELVEATFQANSLEYELYDINTGGVRQNRMYANYILPSYKFSIEGDEYMPFVQVYNSYDKTLLFGSITGLYRTACWNGNLWGIKDSQLIRAKHVGANIDLGSVALSINDWAETIGIARNNLEKLIHKTITDKPIEEVAGKIFRAQRDVKAFVESELLVDAIKQFGSTDYALFNAFTNYTTHKMSQLTTSYDWVMKAQKKITDVFLTTV